MSSSALITAKRMENELKQKGSGGHSNSTSGKEVKASESEGKAVKSSENAKGKKSKKSKTQ